MKPLAPRFVVRKKKPANLSALRCVLCQQPGAEPRALYKGAPLCDRCSRNQTVGGVARVFLNAAGRFLFGAMK